MKIPVNEQETVINFTRDSNEARIYTSDTTVLTKLHKLVSRNTKDWTLVSQDMDGRDHEVIAETYSCPKRLISFRAEVKTRIMTNEQKKAAADRLRKIRESKRNIQNS